MFDYKNNRLWLENLSIVLQVGLTMAGCIAFCFFLGLKLDRWLGLGGIGITVMTLLGVVGGGNVVYRQIGALLPAGEEEPESSKRARDAGSARNPTHGGRGAKDPGHKAESE